MVVLRLSRVGKKSHPTFRLIASDKRKDTVGSYLELLGSYDPHISPMKLELKADRVKYWLSVGAQPSDTVHNLLVEKGVITGTKKVVARAKKVEAIAVASAPVAEAKKKEDSDPVVKPAAPTAEKTAEPMAEEKKVEPKTEEKQST